MEKENLGLGAPLDLIAQLTSAMVSLQDSITGPQNGVKTSLDAISGTWNAPATPPPPANSQAAISAELAASSDVAIGPSVTPRLQALGQSLTAADGQAATTASNFGIAYVAANALATDYQTLQQTNQQLASDKQQYGQAIQTLYAAAGYTDYATPVGTVASAIGTLKTQTQAQQQQIQQLQQQVQKLQSPAPAATTPATNAPLPLFNTTTILAGIAALAVIGGGIWWYTNEQKKKKQLGPGQSHRTGPMSQRTTVPSPAPSMEEQLPPASRPARHSFPMSSRPNATARALMPRSTQARALPPGRTGKRS